MRTSTIGVLLAATVTTATLALAAPASAHTTGIHDNCTELNKKWAHGVGRKGAVDKTSGTRVTTFFRNNDAYTLAMRHNGTLDRDRDGIACEKA